MKAMRVLHLVSTLEAGGIASSLWHILPSLSRSTSLQIEVATLYRSGCFGQRLRREQIKVRNLALTHKYDLSALPRLYRLMRAGKYDLVHAHGWPGNFFIALLSLVLRDPVYVYGEHSITNRRRRPHLKPLDAFIFSRYQRVVAVSQAASDSLRQWLPNVESRLSTIYNGIDPCFMQEFAGQSGSVRAQLGLEDGRPVVLNGGGLDLRKGIDVLVQALARLERNSLHTRPAVLIAGDGALRRQLAEQVKTLGLGDVVALLGFRADFLSLLKTADLFVVASRVEGCPMVVLEAMALGRPIVATAVGGIPELIVDGESGMLVPPEDPDALSQAIAYLLQNAEEASHMGMVARQRVLENFQARDAAQQLAALYAQCV